LAPSRVDCETSVVSEKRTDTTVNSPNDQSAGSTAETPELLKPAVADGQPLLEAVTEPGKVMRIGSMVKQLLEEVRGTQLDVGSRERLAEIHERSIVELAEALSPDLQEELRLLALPFGVDVPSEAELRIAQAQLVGWLEGLFHGIQATLFAQQMAARQQFENMRRIGPGGAVVDGPTEGRPGTYL